MSKSLGNGIALADSSDCIKGKVMRMYTDPHHIRVADPGQVEGNVVFTYLDAFDPDVAAVSSLKEHYQRGGLGDVALKRRLIEVLNTWLEPIRSRRSQISRESVNQVLREGSLRAQARAQGTLDQVKQQMQMLDVLRAT